jgi:hypothetical protein
MAKYSNVRYIGGEPHGLCWIHTQGDGGAYDPAATVAALSATLDMKLLTTPLPKNRRICRPTSSTS